MQSFTECTHIDYNKFNDPLPLKQIIIQILNTIECYTSARSAIVDLSSCRQQLPPPRTCVHRKPQTKHVLLEGQPQPAGLW